MLYECIIKYTLYKGGLPNPCNIMFDCELRCIEPKISLDSEAILFSLTFTGINYNDHEKNFDFINADYFFITKLNAKLIKRYTY